MKTLATPTGKPFRYAESPGGELVVYPSDEHGAHQDKFALAITPYTINLVSAAIRRRGSILMGASRDNPPRNSLGELLKRENQTPQQLSYLSAVLESRGFCSVEREGNAFVLVYRTPVGERNG
jgi:hypothetical protein